MPIEHNCVCSSPSLRRFSFASTVTLKNVKNLFAFESTKNLHHHHHLRFFLCFTFAFSRELLIGIFPFRISFFFLLVSLTNSKRSFLCDADEHELISNNTWFFAFLICRLFETNFKFMIVFVGRRWKLRSNLIRRRMHHGKKFKNCLKASGQEHFDAFHLAQHCVNHFRSIKVTLKSSLVGSRNKFSIPLMRMHERRGKECPSIFHMCVFVVLTKLLDVAYMATEKTFH